MPELKGIDVSQWQGAIDWAMVQADGYSFAVVKATEGLSLVDPEFAANWAGAKAAGLVRGAYHFCRPELGNARQQAQHVVNTVGTLEAGDILALDLETPAGTVDQSAFALDCAGMVAKLAGFPPLLYCSQDWARNRLTDAALAAYPLWLACPGSSCPASIGVWPSVALQQESWTLAVPGIEGEVDGDELARTLDGLRALGKPAVSLRTVVSCAMKPTPDHTSPAVVLLAAGALVAPDGPQTTHWLHCHTSSYSGWLLKAELAAVAS